MTEGLTTGHGAIAALAIALVLAVLHLLAPHIRRLPGVPEPPAVTSSVCPRSGPLGGSTCGEVAATGPTASGG